MMSEPQDSSEENKKFLRSQNIWKTGEKFPVCYVPTVEGMVITTRWIENVLMVVFLSPPYAKAEGTWAEASLMYKTAASLVHQSLPSYDFPFPSDPRILEEVRKAKGNVEVLSELVKFLNKQFPPPPHYQLQKSSSSSVVWDTDEQENIAAEQGSSDRLSLHLLLSQNDENDIDNSPPIPDALLGKHAEQVSRRLSIDNNLQTDNKRNMKSQKKVATTKPKTIQSSSSSSSSNSATSDSSSSSDDDKVGNLEKGEEAGWFLCPFSVNDSRRTAEPTQRMKGKVEERKYLRQALHDLYSEYHILKSFVETVRAESLSSSSRPYNSDAIWLAHHAVYLDLLLLHAVDGPWKPWNELVVDQLTKAFLELLVRSSTNRAYPEILDERVRKWMKRKRVGLSTHFGVIPGYLANAKITESGIHPKGGWENKVANKASPSTFSTFRPKQQSNQHVASDKKG